MSLPPLKVALAPITIAILVALTFVASMGTDAHAARSVAITSSDASASAQANPSVSVPRPGVSGSVTSGPESADLDHDGVPEAVFGTERGFYRIASGTVLQSIQTSTAVRDFAVMGDVDGDGIDDVALALGDTTFPNIRLYDSATGNELWTFQPTQDVFLENLMWTSQEGSTFDLVASDIDGDGANELLATSGYSVYALDGKTGAEKWRYKWRDNLWRVTPAGDLDDDGVIDIVAGTQDGYLVSISGRDGGEIWSRQIVQPFQAIDEKGEDWKLIARSTWDIVPVPGSPSEVIVTSEDGFARRVDVRSGDVAWERKLFDLPVAALSQGYKSRGGNPTSPGDSNFFNLKARLIPDISGDGRADALVTAFQGASGSQDARSPGIYAIDSGSGDLVWRNNIIDITSVAGLDLFETAEGLILAVPARTPAFLDLSTGQPASKAPFQLPSVQNNGRQGGSVVLAVGESDYLFMSPNGDLQGTTDGERWTIARTTGSELTRGDFTGDQAEDILVVAGAQSEGNNFNVEPRSRLIYVIDGSSGDLAWEYMVPDKEFEATGGVTGVRAVADLDGDGKQDVLGYMQDPSEFSGNQGDSIGADSKVVLLSGASGRAIYEGPPVQASYYGIWELVYRNDPGVLDVIRSQVSSQLGIDLDNAWQNEKQQERNDFENSLFQRWEEHRQDQIGLYVSQNGGGSSEEELRQQNEAQMDNDWANIAVGRRSNFDSGLVEESNALRVIGADETLISSYEGQRHADFEAGLEAERVGTYDQWRKDFEQRLQNGEFSGGDGLGGFVASLDQTRPEVEQQWRDAFETSLEQRRVEWIDDQTGGSLELEVQNQLENLKRQLADGGGWLKIDKRIVSVDVISYPAAESGAAIFITGGKDVFIVDTSGQLLWTRSFDSGVYNTPLGGPETDMSFGMAVDWQRPVRVAPDRNGDGYDDLQFSSGNALVFSDSNVSTDGLRFTQSGKVSGPAGSENNGTVEDVPDLSGDGVGEIALVRWRDNAPPEADIIDGATGVAILQLDSFDENSTSLAPTQDFDGDGRPDVIMFERWVDGRDGPRLRVLAAGTGRTIWEFDDFRDLSMVDSIGYSGPIVPATAVDDLTGDGVPEIAVVKHLTWQPGGAVDIFDIRNDKLISSVVTEEVNPNSTQEKRWAPGILAQTVGDLNGDGVSEIAYVTAFGPSAGEKEYRLGVADLASGSVIADFLVTGSSLVGLGAPGKFGVAGLSGDLFLLDISNQLTIEMPGGTDRLTSPVTVGWLGAAPGSFSQVYVDGIEVARTNGDAVELNLRSGEHTVAVRSIDPSGRAVISSVDIQVSKSQLARTIVIAVALIVTLGTFWAPGRRLFERYRLRAVAHA